MLRRLTDMVRLSFDALRARHTASKFVSTPEDWATTNQMVVIRKDGTKFLVEISMIKEREDGFLIFDKDRKKTQEVRNLIRNRINLWPWNWWRNKRTVCGLKGELVYFR
jgi:hypothetical protein